MYHTSLHSWEVFMNEMLQREEQFKLHQACVAKEQALSRDFLSDKAHLLQRKWLPRPLGHTPKRTAMTKFR